VIIDVLIVLVVIGTAWVGFQRGLVQPLLAELLALGTILVILHNRSAFAAVTQALFHANGILAVLVAVVLAGAMGYLGARLGGAIHRMPVVRGVDGFLGVWLQVLFGIAICYTLIAGVIVMDRAFAPLKTPTVNAAQLQALERQLASNAFTSSIVDGQDLHSFDGRAARPGGVRVADLPGIGQLQGLHSGLFLPQVTGSRLAPAVMNVGRRIPGLGSFGSGDLPGKR
jgi:hypothetical protein